MKATSASLIKEYKGLNDAINVAECFGTRDLVRFQQIEAELDKRGYEIVSTTEIRRKIVRKK